MESGLKSTIIVAQSFRTMPDTPATKSDFVPVLSD
jgi:hypothetical protein